MAFAGSFSQFKNPPTEWNRHNLSAAYKVEQTEPQRSSAYNAARLLTACSCCHCQVLPGPVDLPSPHLDRRLHVVWHQAGGRCHHTILNVQLVVERPPECWLSVQVTVLSSLQTLLASSCPGPLVWPLAQP